MAALGGFYGSIRRVLLYRLTLVKPLSDKGLKKILPRIFNITRPKTKTSILKMGWKQGGQTENQGLQAFSLPRNC